MAFKSIRKKKEKIELVSLIDLLFILLVFFLVTSFVVRLPLQERNISIPTPENKPGRAQIVIQLIDNNFIFWIDEDASSKVKEIENRMGYLSRETLNREIVKRLLKSYTISKNLFYLKLRNLVNRADRNPDHNYFVMIRCPDNLPYTDVIEIISRLTKSKYNNISYGCVNGSINDIKNCKSIKTVTENDSYGNRRNNIQIDF